MKLAIIGSRDLFIDNIELYLPKGITEVVSGGAKGIDSLDAEYAKNNNIKLVEFLPDYQRYKRGAPLKRNQKIAEYADQALAFWNGKSKGTLYTIELLESKTKRSQ